MYLIIMNNKKFAKIFLFYINFNLKNNCSLMVIKYIDNVTAMNYLNIYII